MGHADLMRSANRAADIARVSGTHVPLANELLEEAYDHLWYAYDHATRVAHRLNTARRYRAAAVWLEKRDLYQTARAQVWAEMVVRGLRKEVRTPRLMRLGLPDAAS